MRVRKMDVPSRSGRFVSDLAASACGVIVLLIALALFNDRVREHLSIGSSDGFAVLGQVNDVALLIALVAAQAVREQSIEHVSLMAFTGAALVLVIFLLRV